MTLESARERDGGKDLVRRWITSRRQEHAQVQLPPSIRGWGDAEIGLMRVFVLLRSSVVAFHSLLRRRNLAEFAQNWTAILCGGANVLLIPRPN